jgi:hypothetical protein
MFRIVSFVKIMSVYLNEYGRQLQLPKPLTLATLAIDTAGAGSPCYRQAGANLNNTLL